jgi:C-terminal processing protease CtpA/Prc
VKIGESKTRLGKIDRIAKGRKDKAFTGEVSILIDSESASSSELFARTLQIEKRGKIIGDRSAGAVMGAVVIPLEPLTWPYTFPFPISFMNVTVSDFVMSDGERLELTGLMPDLPAIPRPQAYPAGHDPVLAYAASQSGVTISAIKAGELGFIRPRQFIDPERPKVFERVVNVEY